MPMTGRQLITASLRFYRRTHLGVAAGAAVATAVLTGALLVGDSVRYSLHRFALLRLGETRLSLYSGDRHFTTQLADRIGQDLSAPTAAALDLTGIATIQQPDGTQRRANQVHVLGVDERFWRMGGTSPPAGWGARDRAAVNQRLADELNLSIGDRLLLRVAKPSALSRDMPLGSQTDDAIRLPMTVGAIVSDEQFGRFSLRGTQIPPFNVFVPIGVLQQQAEVAGRANILLVGNGDGELSADRAAEALAAQWTLADANAELRLLEQRHMIELRTSRVFLDPPLVAAARAAAEGAMPVLAYFVNELAVGDRTTPYSIVAAYPIPDPARQSAVANPLPQGMSEDAIVINQWLADDLDAIAGDELTLRYYVIGEGRRPIEKSASFRVERIAPTEGPGGDRYLMPDLPGLSDADSTRDWSPPADLDIDLSRIRDQDEKYWEDHRGAPKAFVALEWAQRDEAWKTRFGELTALRWSAANQSVDALSASILKQLSPEDLGLVIRDVRNEALEAAARGAGGEFGYLFIGLSLFLIVAALLLTALMFAFGIEQRSEEIGTLLALGYTAKDVRRYLMSEGAILAAVGAVAGVGLGVAYTQSVLWALRTMWADAIAATNVTYHASTVSLISGLISGLLTAAGSMWWVLRKQAQLPARVLLVTRFGIETAGGIGSGAPTRAALGGLSVGGGVGLAVYAFLAAEASAAGLFFGAGSLLLIGGLLCSSALLRRRGKPTNKRPSLSQLGWRNSVRRSGRSLATITMLACGTFLVVSINAFRHDPNAAAFKRDSGTGGFAIYAQTSFPVLYDLNTPRGRETFGLDDALGEDISFVQMRLLAGDDASCLNLTRPNTPPLLGVDPQQLAERDAFVFVKTPQEMTVDDPWLLLDQSTDDSVPAILDDSVAMWILKKKIGDTLEYVDENGNAFNVRIVGTITNSILQGSLIISEEQFKRRFPSSSGYHVLLVDAPPSRAEDVRRQLDRALIDLGIDSMDAPTRLGLFTAMEHTYLSIFSALGGLGLVVGCVGLGLVVLRNVLERRAELALMRAVGFSRGMLKWLVLSEHWGLLGLGLLCGVIAAAVAVAPSLSHGTSALPLEGMGLTLAAVVLSGVIWTYLAAGAALRGRIINALRSE